MRQLEDLYDCSLLMQNALLREMLRVPSRQEFEGYYSLLSAHFDTLSIINRHLVGSFTCENNKRIY